MMNNGKHRHFFIAAVLLIYLLSAKPLFDTFLLRNGKPEQENVSLPAPADSADYIYRLAPLRGVRHEGEDLYELRGFVFSSANPLLENRIRLVLNGPEGNRVYASQPVPVTSMLRSFKHPQPVSETAEFRVLIAKEVLPPGSYRVGLLLEAQAGARRAYLETGSSIVITPNQVRYRYQQ